MKPTLCMAFAGLAAIGTLGLGSVAYGQNFKAVPLFEGPTTSDNVTEQKQTDLKVAGNAFFPTQGVLVLLDKGNPANSDDTKDLNNWGDVVVFGRVPINIGGKRINANADQATFFSDFEDKKPSDTFAVFDPANAANKKIGYKFISESGTGPTTYEPANANEIGFANARTFKASYQLNSDPVPEPSSVAALGLGAFGLLGLVSKSRKRRAQQPVMAIGRLIASS